MDGEQGKEPMSTRRLFHYTTASRLERILVSGFIRPADAFIGKGERPAVWCTYRPEFEPTAIPMIAGKDGKPQALTFDEMLRIESPIRIEVRIACAPLDWRQWRKLSGVKPRVARELEEDALKQGSYVRDWRMSFEPVHQDQWIVGEFYTGSEWRPFLSRK